MRAWETLWDAQYFQEFASLVCKQMPQTIRLGEDGHPLRGVIESQYLRELDALWRSLNTKPPANSGESMDGECVLGAWQGTTCLARAASWGPVCNLAS